MKLKFKNMYNQGVINPDNIVSCDKNYIEKLEQLNAEMFYTLKDLIYAYDYGTLETVVDWDKVKTAVEKLEASNENN